MILILTAGFGDGHNTAARAVSEALQRSGPVQTTVADVFHLRIPRLNRSLQAAYQTAILHFPGLWRWAYQRLASNDLGSRPNALSTALANELAGLLARQRPSAIVSTYPFYATLLRSLRSRGPVPPLFTVITDSTSVHPSWTNDPSDHYCVPDEDTLRVLAERGIGSERIHVTGFPVSLALTDPLPPATDPSLSPRVLYLPSTPAGHVAATLEALRPLLLQGVRLTLAAGKHLGRLHHTLTRFSDSLPPGQLEVLGWTSRIPEFLRTHDAVICKAGGAILHEVLAARIPAIIDYVVPGQEEGNAELLLRHACALRSQSPLETAQCASRILEKGGDLGRAMRARMVPPLSLPHAAMAIAQRVLSCHPSPATPHAAHPPL